MKPSDPDHLFALWVLCSASCVPGTVHRTGDSLAGKTSDGLSLTESIFNGGNGNLWKEGLAWCGDREAFPKEVSLWAGRALGDLLSVPMFTHLPSPSFNKYSMQGTRDIALNKTGQSPPMIVLHFPYTWLLLSSLPSCHSWAPMYILLSSHLPELIEPTPSTSGHIPKHNHLSMDQMYVLHQASSQYKSPERSNFHTKVGMTDTQVTWGKSGRTESASMGEENIHVWLRTSDMWMTGKQELKLLLMG